MSASLQILAELHDLDIIHRDFKPQNLMLVENMQQAPLRAIDLGSAVLRGQVFMYVLVRACVRLSVGVCMCVVFLWRPTFRAGFSARAEPERHHACTGAADGGFHRDLRPA